MSYIIIIKEEDSKISINSSIGTINTLLVLKKLVEHIEGKIINHKQVVLDCAESKND